MRTNNNNYYNYRKRIKTSAVIFDMDGTLIDSTENIVSALSASLSFNNIEPVIDKSSFSMLMGKTLQETLDLIIPEHKNNLSHKVAEYYVEYYYKNFIGKAVAYPNVLCVLKTIKEAGCKIALATTKHTECAISELKGAGLFDYFDLVKGIDPGIPHKPDPFLYYQICEEFSLNSESTIMVGDSGRDILFGQNAKAYTVAVTYGAWQKQRFINESIIPDIFIDDILELKKLFF